MALDQNALDELRELDPDGSMGLVAQIIQTYLTDTKGILSRLSPSLAGRDLVTLARDAHSLKSSSLSVGASEVSKAAARLEAAGKAGSADACPELIRDLTAQFADAEKLLHAVMTRK